MMEWGSNLEDEGKGELSFLLPICIISFFYFLFFFILFPLVIKHAGIGHALVNKLHYLVDITPIVPLGFIPAPVFCSVHSSNTKSPSTTVPFHLPPSNSVLYKILTTSLAKNIMILLFLYIISHSCVSIISFSVISL